MESYPDEVMKGFAAFLGHQPHISLAELSSALPRLKLTQHFDRGIVTFLTKDPVTPELLNVLGGTVLFAEEVRTNPKDIRREIPDFLLQWRRDSKVKGKLTFSLRTSGLDRNEVRQLYRQMKVHLRAHTFPSRYVGSERKPLAPGILPHYGIPGPLGVEVVILKRGKDTWVGRTTAAQNIEAYRIRDVEKPQRDTRTGLLPPKLAQVMLNLGSWLVALRESKGKLLLPLLERPLLTVWDPFAGSGVIPIECLQRRWNVFASDKNKRALRHCEENIEWFRSKMHTPKSVRSEMFVADACKSIPPPREPDCIVTETTLGPPLQDYLPLRSIPKALREAEVVEKAFLVASRQTCPNTPVVCTVPVYADREGMFHHVPDLLSELPGLGYQLFLPENLSASASNRQTLTYLRPGQFVGREILCLLPVNPETTPSVTVKRERVTKKEMGPASLMKLRRGQMTKKMKRVKSTKTKVKRTKKPKKGKRKR